MWLDTYNNLTNAEKERFAKLVNYLLNKTFVTREIFESKDKIGKIKADYRFIENMNNTYSHKNVVEYVEKRVLNNKNELESAQLKLDSDEDLILTIHSMLKGWDKNIFYKIELQEGNVPTSGYNIPKMTYLRRRKL